MQEDSSPSAASRPDRFSPARKHSRRLSACLDARYDPRARRRTEARGVCGTTIAKLGHGPSADVDACHAETKRPGDAMVCIEGNAHEYHGYRHVGQRLADELHDAAGHAVAESEPAGTDGQSGHGGTTGAVLAAPATGEHEQLLQPGADVPPAGIRQFPDRQGRIVCDDGRRRDAGDPDRRSGGGGSRRRRDRAIVGDHQVSLADVFGETNETIGVFSSRRAVR